MNGFYFVCNDANSKIQQKIYDEPRKWRPWESKDLGWKQSINKNESYKLLCIPMTLEFPQKSSRRKQKDLLMLQISSKLKLKLSSEKLVQIFYCLKLYMLHNVLTFEYLRKIREKFHENPSMMVPTTFPRTLHNMNLSWGTELLKNFNSWSFK